MKAITITTHGSYNVLKVLEQTIPEVKKGQVRIRVRAAGLNFAV